MQAYEQINLYHITGIWALAALFTIIMAASWVATQREFARRKKIEQSLRESLAFQRAIFDGSFYGIVVCDIAGGIRLINRAMEHMLGYRSNEVVGQHMLELFLDRDEIADRARQLSEELGEEIPVDTNVLLKIPLLQGSEEREWTYIAKDGRRLPVLFSVTVMHDAQGQITGFMGVAKDITERRLIETMKNEFISTVSHELRTPLTSIRGALGLILGSMAADLPDQVKTLTTIAHKNSERLVRLINNILDIEKIETGHTIFDRKPVAIGLLLRQAAEEAQGLAKDQGLSIRTESELDDAIVIGDMDRLLQVVANLLSNAVKFSPPSDFVLLKAKRDDKGRVCVSVTDHGPGVPQEFRSRIFSKFAQADSSTSRSKSGSGLGLSISKAIVESMDGTLEYESEPGRTVFTLHLPDASSMPSASEAVHRTKPHILVCEDDSDIASLLRMILEKEGFDCTVAATGKEALKLLQKQEFAAMTLDLTLPDCNGIELIQDLRKTESLRALPVIVITAEPHTTHNHLKEEAVVIVDWLTKPIDTQRLRSALRVVARSDNKARILHIEDDAGITGVIAAALGGEAETVPAHSLAEARQKLSIAHYDLAVLDVGLPDGSGLDLLPELNEAKIPVIILSVHETDKSVQEYVRASLVKSVVSETKIVETIKSIIGGKNDH